MNLDRKMNKSSKTRKHIDDVQAATVDEHFKLILNDETLIDSDSSIVTPDDLPDWYDRKMYKQTQDFYRRYSSGVLLNSTIGLIAVFAIPQILKVLTHTKQSSTICSAFKRYMRTTLYLHKFYISDPDDPDSDWYKSINVIRWKHKTSSKMCEHARVGGIYQRDMVFTQFAFIAYALTMPEAIGIRMKPEEEEAFNHFWRVMGHILGIPDRLNICRKTVAETRMLCQKLIDNVFADYLNNAPFEFYNMATVSLDGIWYIDLSVDTDAMLSLVYKIHGLKYKKSLGWYSWFNTKYRDALIRLSFVPYFGIVLRTYFNILLRFIFWYTENYGALYAWLKFPRKNIELTLYPKYE